MKWRILNERMKNLVYMEKYNNTEGKVNYCIDNAYIWKNNSRIEI